MPMKYSQADPIDPVDGSEIWGVTQNGEDRKITLDDVAAYSAAGIALATAAEIQAGTSTTKAIAPGQLYDAAAQQTLTDGANIAWDMADGFNAKVTLGGDRTLDEPTNFQEGISYALQIIQDGTGTRLLTLPASFHFGAAGAPTLSTAAGKKDFMFIYCYDAATPAFRVVFSKDS